MKSFFILVLCLGFVMARHHWFDQRQETTSEETTTEEPTESTTEYEETDTTESTTDSQTEAAQEADALEGLTCDDIAEMDEEDRHMLREMCEEEPGICIMLNQCRNQFLAERLRELSTRVDAIEAILHFVFSGGPPAGPGGPLGPPEGAGPPAKRGELEKFLLEKIAEAKKKGE